MSITKRKEKPNAYLKRLDEQVKEMMMLPFIKDVGKGRYKKRSFWHINTSGDYLKDTEIGEKYGMLLLDFMRRYDDRTLLTQCVMGMKSAGDEAKGIEVGFLTFFARAAQRCIINPTELHGQIQIERNRARSILRMNN